MAKRRPRTLEPESKYDAAMQAFDEAVKLDPEYANAWNNKGRAFYGLGKYDEAIQAYDEAIRLDPSSVSSWMMKCFALQSLGRYDEASVAFATAKQLEDSDVKNKSYTLDKMVTLTYPEDWIIETGSGSLTQSSWFYMMGPETTKVVAVTPESITENVLKRLARKYVSDYFDCSEISAYAEHWLEAHGINTKIVVNNRRHHAWLICQLDSGDWIPVEPQMGENCVITDPSSPLWNYDIVFDNIYDSMELNRFEWDWWNS